MPNDILKHVVTENVNILWKATKNIIKKLLTKQNSCDIITKLSLENDAMKYACVFPSDLEEVANDL